MSKTATIYRMVTPEHLCPWGLKARDLLRRKGYDIDDHYLRSKEENKEYKKQNHVDETPQIFIEGQHIGGYEALREHLGKEREDAEGTTYQPVIAIFAVCFLMAVSAAYALTGTLLTIRLLELFIAFSMCALGIQKLQDLDSFSTMFLSYDLLSQRYVPYAYFYPFGEAGAGVLMIAGVATFLSAPVALFIGLVGSISVFKAVYIDKRELKCACVGGGSNVPLGFISLTENVMMVAMAIWMALKAFYF